MDPLVAAVVVLGVLAVATALGLVLRARRGRVTREERTDAPEITPDVIGTRLGGTATLVQFSTEYCARCPGVRRALTSLAAGRPGVVHAEVDLTHRPDLTKQFDVRQTPTVLVVDPSGRVRARFHGDAHPQRVGAELDALGVTQTSSSSARSLENTDA
ncbi:thioredoxin family protein [uncultured Microbacterium sp.]|uniref:TlpA family protein disulfide reductase n=1 Tax=uncultured Microbacterium sp. TaxID=191216 RepID=UPI0025E68FA0|nr:thioredoxin family protein [uncultured Microbacterium sp.]